MAQISSEPRLSPTLYAALGDSTGVGTGALPGEGYVERVFARIRQSEPSARLLNLSENGATAAAVRDRQAPAAASARPSLVTLFVGGNDLWRGVPETSFGRSLDAIARVLRPTGAQVVCATIADLSHAPVASLVGPMLGLGPKIIDERLGTLNFHIRRVATENGFLLVDIHQETARSLPRHPEFFSHDGFHPSASGYQALAEALWPSVARALERRRAAR